MAKYPKMSSLKVILQCLLASLLYTLSLTLDSRTQYKEDAEAALKILEDEDQMSYIIRIQQIFCPSTEMCNYYSQEIPPFVDDKLLCRSFCQKCRCDDDCYQLGDCCPDFDDSEIFSVKTDQKVSCVSLSLNQTNDLIYERAYMMISSCSPSYKDQSVRDKCESFNWNLREFDIRIPVTLNETTVFKNKYCAMCNGVTKYDPWSANVICESQFRIPSYYTYQQTLALLWEKRDCNYILTMPPDKPSPDLRQCTAFDDLSLISKCNVTGKWRTFNKHVVDACASYTLIFNKTYKNIFCFICNSDNYELPCDHAILGDNIDGVNSYSTQVLTDKPLSSSGSSISKFKGACQNKRESEKGNCREVFCAPGKWLHNGRCKTLVKKWAQQKYQLSAVYRVKPPISVNTCNASNPNPILYLAEKVDSVLVPRKLEGKVYKDHLKIDGYVEIKDVDCPRGERTYKKPRGGKVLYMVKISAAFSLLDDTVFDRSEIEEKLFLLSMSTSSYSLPGYGKVDLVPDADVTYKARQSLPNVMNISGISLTQENLINLLISYKGEKLKVDLSRLLYCPYVILKKGEYRLLEGGSLRINSMSRTVSYVDFELEDNSDVHLCADVYFKGATSSGKSLHTSGFGFSVILFLSVIFFTI